MSNSKRDAENIPEKSATPEGEPEYEDNQPGLIQSSADEVDSDEEKEANDIANDEYQEEQEGVPNVVQKDEFKNEQEKDITCPITGYIFLRPTILIPSGATVERVVAERLLATGYGYPIPDTKPTAIVDNFALVTVVDTFLRKHPELKAQQYAADKYQMPEIPVRAPDPQIEDILIGPEDELVNANLNFGNEGHPNVNNLAQNLRGQLPLYEEQMQNVQDFLNNDQQILKWFLKAMRILPLDSPPALYELIPQLYLSLELYVKKGQMSDEERQETLGKATSKLYQIFLKSEQELDNFVMSIHKGHGPNVPYMKEVLLYLFEDLPLPTIKERFRKILLKERAAADGATYTLYQKFVETKQSVPILKNIDETFGLWPIQRLAAFREAAKVPSFLPRLASELTELASSEKLTVYFKENPKIKNEIENLIINNPEIFSKITYKSKFWQHFSEEIRNQKENLFDSRMREVKALAADEEISKLAIIARDILKNYINNNTGFFGRLFHQRDVERALIYLELLQTSANPVQQMMIISAMLTNRDLGLLSTQMNIAMDVNTVYDTMIDRLSITRSEPEYVSRKNFSGEVNNIIKHINIIVNVNKPGTHIQDLFDVDSERIDKIQNPAIEEDKVSQVINLAEEVIDDYLSETKGVSGRFFHASGRQRAIIYLELLKAAETPAQQLMVIVAILGNTDSKLLRNNMTSVLFDKIEVDQSEILVSELYSVFHVEPVYNLMDIMKQINIKANTNKAGVDVKELFAAELAQINQSKDAVPINRNP